MSAPELVYFQGRGRAEIIRMILTSCGIKFSQVYLESREEFLALRPELEFGQVPLLRIDGKNIVQTGAIVRHLARAYKLYGEDESERTKVDTYYEGTRDFAMSFLNCGFVYPTDKVKDNTQASVSKYLPVYEQILKNNGSNGHLVGSSLTLADLGLLEVLLVMKDYYESSVFDGYPEIQTFLKNLSQQHFYERYLNEVRQPVNTPEYVTNVKQVLAF